MVFQNLGGQLPPPCPLSRTPISIRHFQHEHNTKPKWKCESERNFKESVLILVFYSYVLVFYSYSTRILLVYTRIYSCVTRVLLVCYSYVLVCYSYVTRMYSCGVLVTIHTKTKIIIEIHIKSPFQWKVKFGHNINQSIRIQSIYPLLGQTFCISYRESLEYHLNSSEFVTSP